jgi:hypothetical protein
MTATESQKRAIVNYRRNHREAYNTYQREYYRLNQARLLAKQRLPENVAKKRAYYQRKAKTPKT